MANPTLTSANGNVNFTIEAGWFAPEFFHALYNGECGSSGFDGNMNGERDTRRERERKKRARKRNRNKKSERKEC